MAATSTDFYLGLLQRGIASFDAEHYPEANTYLKLAAFGLVDSIENYEKAQVYLTLSYDRLGDAAKSRDAARRVIVAERVQRKFGSLALPAGVASSFDTLVTRLLSGADVAFLKRPPQSTTPPVQQPRPQQTATPVSVPKPPAPSPVSAAATTTTNDVVPTSPPKKPAEKPVVKPVPPATPTTISSQEIDTRLASADRAMASAQLPEARRIYRTLLEASGVSRDVLIRTSEGLYRARDFEGALAAFQKIGTLRRGEEPYHYYIAVACYETHQYSRAKSEMSAAVPFIEITPDVARYRAKIESATD